MLVCLGFVGCRKKAPEVPAGAMPGMAEAPPVDLTAINAMLRDYVLKRKVIPKDINDLVTSGYAPSLPPPPRGKQYVIQLLPMGYTVVLADE